MSKIRWHVYIGKNEQNGPFLSHDEARKEGLSILSETKAKHVIIIARTTWGIDVAIFGFDRNGVGADTDLIIKEYQS